MDRKRASAAILQGGGMASQEATFLNESVYQVAAQMLRSATPGNRLAIVCLTDGTVDIPSESTRWTSGSSVAQGHIHTEEEAVLALLAAGASFNAVIEKSALSYFVEASRHPSRADLKRYQPGSVKTYAEPTGGIVLSSNKRNTANDLGVLLEDLRSLYTLGYRPSQDMPDGSLCHISLGLTPESRIRFGNPIVRTRTGYYR